MTFGAPLLLAGLALVPLAAVAYVVAQRRRRRFAVRYTNVELLAAAAGRSWGRHLPMLLGLLALAALLVALARPQRTVAAERREATVVLVTDTSSSMRATDVKPTRLGALKVAARGFVAKVPDEFRVGLVSFSTTADEIVSPTTDKARVNAGLGTLKVHASTAIGDGMSLGLDAARAPVTDVLGRPRRLPAAIVLISDGSSVVGRDPITVAQRARRLGIRVYTVALGTPTGTMIDRGKRVPVPPDPLTLQEIARTTGGEFFRASDAARLRAVYANLGVKLATTRERQEVTSAFAGAALVLLLGAMAVGLVRGGRLP